MNINERFAAKVAEMEKRATGDTTQIDAMPATEQGHEGTTKRLQELFETRDGLAQNAKKDLSRFFDTKNPMYAMRKQSLIEKVAHQLELAKGSK